MPFVEKVGYVVIIYWGCQLLQNVIYKIYKSFFSSNMSVDLFSMGKWGVVTGCSQGIGKAYAEALAKMGFNIVLVSPGIDKLKVIASDIESSYNVKTKVIELNFAEGIEANGAIEKEMFGLEVGILINSLGMCYPHPEYFLDLPRKEKIYTNIIQCNIVVTTNMCRILLPQMVVRGRGIIINVASSAAVMPSPLLTVFAATKAYILKFSKDLHVEYGKRGIIVQCLLPGSVTNHTPDSPSRGWMVPTPDKYVQSAIRTIGKDNVTTGFFPHTMVVGIARLAHRLSSTLVIMLVTRAMEGNRNRALRRYVG